MPVRLGDAARPPGGRLGRDILAVLKRAAGPMSGRAITDHFCARGRHVHLSAIYRALAGLHARRRVKRIELIDSYILPRDAVVIEALCSECGTLVGIAAPRLVAALAHKTQEHSFSAERYVIELTGRCAACSTLADLTATIPTS